MLRIVSFIVAVAATIVIPFTQAEAGKNGGMSGGSRGSSPSFSGARSSFSGVKSGGTVHSLNTIHSSNKVLGNKVSVLGPKKIIVGDRRHHHRRFFVGVGAYGLYDTCWRWVQTAYGLRRVWDCDPYSYY
jgi:hypothetical protein